MTDGVADGVAVRDDVTDGVAVADGVIEGVRVIVRDGVVDGAGVADTRSPGFPHSQWSIGHVGAPPSVGSYPVHDPSSMLWHGPEPDTHTGQRHSNDPWEHLSCP